MKKITIFIFALSLPFFIFAQEDNSNLEDELFGGDEDSVIAQEEANSTGKGGFKFKADLDEASATIESKKFRIGGSLSSSLGLNYLWQDPYSKKEDYLKSFKSADGALRTKLNASLFFDARPQENLKLYGKFLFGFPFEKTLQGSVEVKNPMPPNNNIQIPVAVNGAVNIKIHELYTDFSAKDIAFFRFGKHTVKWGTGYFYSPADVINLSRIDPQDPTAERDGAVSLRTHIIIPKTQHNIWLYLLPPMQADKFKPEYTAGAAKAEFVIGNWELGIGGWYKYEKAPRAIATLSGSIAGKVAVFAEGVFAWGSDYKYYRKDFTSYEEKNKPFFQATLGGSYSNSDSHTSLSLQYYYNGFGYKQAENDRSLIEMKYLQMGQHYIAFTISQNKIGTDKLSAHLFQQFAISELEGFSKLSLNWNIYKFASMSTGLTFSYPLSPASKSKGSIGYELSFKLGGGKF